MRQKLDKKWAAFLLTLPESGTGYQRIDLFFADGSMLRDIVAYNAEEIEIPRQYSNKEMTKIQIHKNKPKVVAQKEERTLSDYEYLLHHIEVGNAGEERVHHCFVYDHLGNMFSQGHLLVKDGKVYVDEKEIKEGLFHFIVCLEANQEVAWSNEEAEQNNIRPKNMKAGMTLKEKAKEW